MAGSEGSGPTDLLSGWSCVVHRPSEDPEPSELPSTVDMAAFSSGLSVEATQGTQHQDSCDSESDSDSDSNNSGSEVSGSCSPSDSSDSETSSSSAGSSSRSSSPEFSVTSSQTNGLRLKIATVRKSCASPVEKTHAKSKMVPQESSKGPSVVVPHSTLTSTSEESACSQSSSDSSTDSDEDDEDDDEDVDKVQHTTTTTKVGDTVSDNIKKSASGAVKKQQVPVTKNTERNVQEKKAVKKETSNGSSGQKGTAKTKTRPTRRSRKMASLPLSRGSTGSSSDNESSDSDSKMLASLSLQEIRQEDLAAILPDQQECDAFGAFDCRPDKSSPQTGDGSGSDMELPQQAVNALLQRTTDSSSDSEPPTPLNPHTLYANSLLQQFVAQTQMLNAPSSLPPTSTDLIGISSAPTAQATCDASQNSSIDLDLAKRKRGRPKKPSLKSKKCSNSSAKSDDLGKMEPLKPLNLDFCGNPNVSPDSGIQNSSDHISSPEPSPCPPNVKHKLVSNVQEVEKKKETLENSKHIERDARVSLNTRGSTNVKITQNRQRPVKLKEQSKIPITSNSFDRVLYGNADRVLYPPRRKAGRPPVTRKGPGRPTKQRSGSIQEVKPPDKPTEIIKKQLDVKSISNKKKGQNDKTTPTCDNGRNKNFGKNLKETAVVQKKSKSVLLREICERVSERLDINNKHPTKRKIRTKGNAKIGVRPPLGTKTKTEVRYATFKNAKLMHSKHKHKKHKKCKFRILKPVNTTNQDQKLDQEIEKLMADFVKLCCISSQKSAKESIPEMFKALKKSTKKRKISEYNERKKKKINVTSSTDKETTPNEQRLPLKKRHYHLSANVHSENKADPNGPTEGHEKKREVQGKEGKHQVSATTCKANVDKSKSSSTSKNSTVSTTVPVKNEPSAEVVSTEPSTLNGNLTTTHEVVSKSTKVRTHIDEAIEATITRYSHNNNNNTVANSKPQGDKSVSPVVVEEKSNVPLTATTPKKRHWLEVKNNNNILENKTPEDDVKTNEKLTKSKTSLENVVLELKMKKKLTETGTKKVAKDEIVAQIITRKKNRLEDLTSNLASKINTVTKEGGNSTDMNQKKKKEPAGKNEEVATVRNTVIKSPVCKKIKPPDIDKLDSITAENPTGIFMPTVDIELHIPSTTIETNKENVALKKETVEEDTSTKLAVTTSQITQSPENDESTKKKIRKRRAINRTGFPTVKKKKKKPFPTTDDKIPSTVLAVDTQHLEVKTNVCDRVPLEGEKYSAFVQRTEKIVVSDVLLEKLQKSANLCAAENAKNVEEKPTPRLPTDTPELQPLAFINIKQERPSSRLSIKQEKRDKSVSSETSDSIISHASKRLKADPMYESYADLDDLSLEERLERSRAGRRPSRTIDSKKQQDSSKFVIHKRRLRDVSPSSSDESKKNNRKAPRWRKRYLVAGLFSDYYKEDDEVVRQRRSEAASRPTKLIYKPEEHRYGLLPPPYHCGKFLRCRKLPFQLPYDLWWQHMHNQLPGRDIVPSWNYRKIRTNVYNVKSTAMGACESQACNCTPMSGCGDDCINRLVYVECPGTHKCQNQKIQRHEWAPGIEKFMTESKGWGVRTNLAIKSGEFILEYVGEVVSDQEFKERMATRYAHDTHHYCLHLDGGLVIDGHRMGGEGRFVNHSCEPNCEMQKWSVNGQFRMALFALRDIRSGEELTYDYNFSLFNPADGQVCKCGSEHCRGVIGGKSQRARQQNSSSSGRVGRPRKNRAKRSSSAPKETTSNVLAPITTNSVAASAASVVPNQMLLPIVPLLPSVKPMTGAQRTYVREHHCFLPRNLTRVRRLRERSASTTSVGRTQSSTPTGGIGTSNGSGNVTDHRNCPSTFLNHLNAIRQPRNMKTRRLAQAEDDPELNKTAKLAAVLKDLCGVVSSAKDENGELLCTPFVTLPSRRKLAEYYARISEPIDLTTIEQNIATGVYKDVDSFDCDMMRLFNNAVKFFGRTSETGIAATRLKKSYQEAKQEHITKLEEVLGEKISVKFISRKNKNVEEDVIRCICGMYRDEGLMIQCERCLVWQHCECIKADPNAPSYHCERCTPRVVDLEIPLDEYTEHGHRFYMTLLRDDLQLRQGDTVYVLRDIPIPGTDKKHDYKTIGEIEYTELDIFRIERLWKDSQTGQRYAYGHHYLRPHETFHEPTRKFFPNEVMRVPLYEAVPVELIIGHCWVMDLNTYCKGRPLGAPEDHIYICEYRVDKSARLFSKISKTKFPICTKSYAFERFDTRLKVSRTYTPHDLDPAIVKPRGRKMQDGQHQPEMTTTTTNGAAKDETNRRTATATVNIAPVVKTRAEQKTRLNKILLNLLSKMPTKQVLDVSYLLEGGRRRKKQT